LARRYPGVSPSRLLRDAQRQATKDAGTIAGLGVLRIIRPTALVAYGSTRGKEETIAVTTRRGLRHLVCGSARGSSSHGQATFSAATIRQKVSTGVCGSSSGTRGSTCGRTGMRCSGSGASRRRGRAVEVARHEINLPFSTGRTLRPKAPGPDLTAPARQLTPPDRADPARSSGARDAT